MKSYLYVDSSLRNAGTFTDQQLETLSERHRFRAPAITLGAAGSLHAQIAGPAVDGVVFELAVGLPGRRHLRLASYGLRCGRQVFLYWPVEEAIEKIDRERMASLWRHWIAYQAGSRLIRLLVRMRSRRARAFGSNGSAPAPAPVAAAEPDPATFNLLADEHASAETCLLDGAVDAQSVSCSIDEIGRQLHGLGDQIDRGAAAESLRAAVAKLAEDMAAVGGKIAHLQSRMLEGQGALTRLGGIIDGLGQAEIPTATRSAPIAPAPNPAKIIDGYRQRLAQFEPVVAPVAFTGLKNAPTSAARISGTGIYLRTDYWATLISGGSYGHTCYVAKELDALTERLTCMMSSHYALLDDLGIRQELIRPPIDSSSELDLLFADECIYEPLRSRFEALRPAYIYERLCLANFVGARLSHELNIPYIVEYNGSEISMRRSFGSGAFKYEALLLAAEQLAFRQATAITVVSDHVRDDVVRRGIDSAKVLVNPNGVDCDEYSPATPELRHEIRSELGLPETARVIGFIGTYGGWHGIDVLAEGLPKICEAAPAAMFLLIGDGNLKPLVTDAIRKHQLQDRVVDVGRTSQRMGARYLKAADICVSPHSSHMQDSPFFGSPTKLFEYMALGSGIVASDLEQIGTVLSPSLRSHSFVDGAPPVDRERSVLCRPGDVGDFVACVLGLVRHPDVAAALGRNAREAAGDHYSWTKHVARIWDHVCNVGAAPALPTEAAKAAGG